MSASPPSRGPKENAEASARSNSTPNEAAIRAHLQEVVASPAFETSKRSRDLLTYLVEQTLFGREDQIKERSVGEDVFGRPGYEPSEQNVVRVAVNELRRRLAQFYEAHPESEIHIELPRGSYIPVFHIVEAAPAAPEMARAGRRRKKLLWIATGIVTVAAIASWIWRPKDSAVEAFWQPVLSAKQQPLIWATGWGAVMTEEMRNELTQHQGAGNPYRMEVKPNSLIVVDQLTAFGHVNGAATIMSWLAQNRHPAELRLGNWQMPAAVHDRPLILFGALNNPWTVDLTRELRFSVQQVQGEPRIIDRVQSDRYWALPHWNDSRGYSVSADYGIVTRVIDRTTGQVRIAIGGLCHYASQAGAEFITSPKYWTDIDQVAPKGWQSMNMQVVLEMRVIEKAPEGIKAVAWHFW